MSAITKEQLQQIEAAAKEVLWPVVWSEKKARKHFSEKITPEVVLELARIALASLEAEAVGFIVRNKKTGQFGSWMHPKADWFNDDGYEVMSAYIAPPAPVAVPNEMTMQKALSAIERLSWQECTRDAYMLGWNACRAAMLQGAEPVQEWIPCSERMPDKLIPVMVMYADGEMWSAIWTGTKWDDGTEFPDPHAVTHWQEMPAAPQQEVK